MKTDYELIKDFPKVLYHITYNGEVHETRVKEAHFCGKYGIEIDLGNGDYIYDRTRYSHKIEYGQYTNFGNEGSHRLQGYCVDKEQAYYWAKMLIQERQIEDKRDKIYSAYVYAQRASGSITFDFTKK